MMAWLDFGGQRWRSWQTMVKASTSTLGRRSPCSSLLGRLFDRVDLIQPVSNVHPSIRRYIRPSTRSFFDLNEIWHVGRGRWVMHDGMQYDPIQGQGHEPFNVGNLDIFKRYLLRHLQWEMASDHWCLYSGLISKFDRASFLIFGLVFVLRDFEVGMVRPFEESIVSPVRCYV